MEDKQNNQKWLYVVIGVLILIVIGQSIMLLGRQKEHQFDRARGIKTLRPHQAAQPAAPALYVRTAAPAYRSHYRPSYAFDDWDSMWDPFQEMENLHRGMAKLMSQLGQNLDYAGPLQASQSLGIGFSPNVDFEDAGDYWLARFDIPGLDKDKIQVEVQNGMLTVTGERKSERTTEDQAKGFYSSEIQYGSFSRSIPLPPSADESKVEASYDKGVLTVQIGKKTEAETAEHKVQVK